MLTLYPCLLVFSLEKQQQRFRVLFTLVIPHCIYTPYHNVTSTLALPLDFNDQLVATLVNDLLSYFCVNYLFGPLLSNANLNFPANQKQTVYIARNRRSTS